MRAYALKVNSCKHYLTRFQGFCKYEVKKPNGLAACDNRKGLHITAISAPRLSMRSTC